MKPDFNKKLFDEYAWKARVAPVLISTSPIAIVGFAFGKLDSVSTLISIFSAFGVLFLASQVVRSQGRRIEQQLIKRWDGLPTTRMLRFRTPQNPILFTKRRRRLEEVSGLRLPQKRQENTNSSEADEIYIAATRMLISKIREQKARFPRVHEENINYGFRRNLLALKTFALGLLILLFTLMAVYTTLVALSLPVLIAASILLALSGVWLFNITPEWVEDAANCYAERLFEALDEGL